MTGLAVSPVSAFEDLFGSGPQEISEVNSLDTGNEVSQTEELFVSSDPGQDLFTAGQGEEEAADEIFKTEGLTEAGELFSAGEENLPVVQEQVNEVFPVAAVEEEGLFSPGVDGQADPDPLLLTDDDLSQDPQSSFSSGENQAEDGLTEEEKAALLAPFENLRPLLTLPDPEYVQNQGTIAKVSALPTKYDPRTNGLVSSVKNQYPYGMCWAFSSTTSMESNLLKQGLGEYDLSEEHLAYFLAHRVGDPLGNTEYDKNIIVTSHSASPEYEYRSGGNQILAALFLAGWSGFGLENEVPYPTDVHHKEVYPSNPSPSLAYQTTAYLKDAVITEYHVDRVKELISEYGTVSANLCMSTTYLNGKTMAYSYPGYNSVDHAVSLVGWDDTYSADNFLARSFVTQDGAWIAKNSWGEDWGEKGYFYISYECETLTNLVSLSGTISPPYPNNYYYDGTSSFIENSRLNPKGSSGTTALANIFQVKAGKGLSETLGEIVIEDYKDDSVYGIQIYTNLSDPNDPVSGTMAFSTPQRYRKKYSGIATVALEHEIILAPDSYFSVVLTNEGTTKIPYLLEQNGFTDGDWMNYSAQLDKGQSFSYTDGVWTDLCTAKNQGYCARIKAHTGTLNYKPSISLAMTSYTDYPGKSVSLVPQVSGISDYTVIFTSSNPSVATVASSGLVKTKAPGTAMITCSVQGLPSLSKTCTVTVKKLPVPSMNTPEAVDYTTVKLTWEGVSPSNGYQIERRLSSASAWTRIATVVEKTRTYTDKTAILGNVYYYRVRSYVTTDSSVCMSSYSTSVKGASALNATPAMRVRQKTRKVNAVDWKKVNGVTGYVIYRKKAGGSYVRINVFTGNTNSNVYTYYDTKASPGIIYYYAVRPYRKVGSKIYLGPVRIKAIRTMK